MNGITKTLGFVKSSLRASSRTIHGNAELIENCNAVKNRNPRNLELLRIARKPSGYHLDRQVREYWHTLKVTKAPRHVAAEIYHFENGPVITVSTKDWAIKKQLYRLSDTAAYINLGRVLAQRCLESGISMVSCHIEVTKGGKMEAFIKELENGGIELKEPTRYKKPNPWDQHRPEKPWDPTIE
ncbi:large ribosomal subunit protein uL18m [Neodiprion pinetum]|uniref:Large ribosomal subunit protein uL18m n=1 Tax=Neodiprion lecontei TaxID=441921 RepID=A0A6J0C6V1_NEOLC|nr:39S ribosomal protein L18, mitochondrial [Neodiprion lecontei]XP_046474549.1 39S ribosomal protein L18, mitochondrial [Neodiprion pinetum]